MATLTVPENEMWVNLSPYEKNRIIASGLSQTDLGRDMLAQDYILKQLTATLMYPEDELGQKFWDRVYAKAQDAFGTTDIPINTFNKVWIIPEKANVFVNGKSVFVVKNYLKVMLEEDYLALESNRGHDDHGVGVGLQDAQDEISTMSKNIVREVLIPELEKEVNTGKNFANLRQIFNSMILATWYKQNLKKSLLGQVYVNQNKVNGIDLEDKQVKEKIYNQYLAAFKQGVYDLVREDYDSATQQVIPRKYFSGGIVASQLEVDDHAMATNATADVLNGNEQIFTVENFSADAATLSSVKDIETAFPGIDFSKTQKFFDEGKISMEGFEVYLEEFEILLEKKFKDHPLFSDFNKKVIHLISSQIKDFYAVEHKNPMAGFINGLDLVEAINYLINSQAWISSPMESSPITERGIFQGEDGWHYERDLLDPKKAEKQLLNYFFPSAETGLLFRNRETLLNAVGSCLFSSRLFGEKKIFLSPLMAGEDVSHYFKSSNVEVYSPDPTVSDIKGAQLYDELIFGSYNALVIHKDEIPDMEEFLNFLLENNNLINEQDEFNHVIIYGYGRFKPGISDQMLQTLKERDISLSGLSIFGEDSEGAFVFHSVEEIMSAAMWVSYTDTDYQRQLKELLKKARYVVDGTPTSFMVWDLALMDSSFLSNSVVEVTDDMVISAYEHLSTVNLLNRISDIRQGYTDLLSRLLNVEIMPGSVYLNELLDLVQSRTQRNVDLISEWLSSSDSGSQKNDDLFREVLSEYRILLKYYQYLRFYAYRQQGSSPVEEQQMLSNLEFLFDHFFTTSSLKTDSNYHHASLITSSAMGTITMVLDQIAAAGQTTKPKVVLGHHVYFEIDNLREVMDDVIDFSSYEEQIFRDLIYDIKKGKYVALFTDPIANNSGKFNENRKRSLPVSDLMKLLPQLTAIEYQKPFYLVLDVSLFGPSFNLDVFLEGLTLPKNFHVITYTSLVKLHQQGLELLRGGALTVYSSDQPALQRIIKELKASRKKTGTHLEMLDYIPLESLWTNHDQIIDHTKKIMRNTLKFAQFAEKKLSDIDYVKVMYPGLESHPDHALWEENHQLGVPFIYLEFEKNDHPIYEFIIKWHMEMYKRKVGGVVSRDSFGFSFVNVMRFSLTENSESYRIGLPPVDETELEAIQETFEAAFNSVFIRGEVDMDDLEKEFIQLYDLPVGDDSEGEDEDHALATQPVDELQSAPGGIDLNANHLDLRVDGDISEYESFDPAMLKDFRNNGFRPVIINVAPISNIPLLVSKNRNAAGLRN